MTRPTGRGGVVTAEELRALTTTAGGKYHARRTWVEELGRWFASQHEANAAVTLHRRQQAGEIRDLSYQVPFDLRVNGVHVCRYVSDFCWTEPRTLVAWAPGNPTDRDRVLWDVVVVGDAKGVVTPTYRIKRALMKACFGIEIVEL